MKSKIFLVFMLVAFFSIFLAYAESEKSCDSLEVVKTVKQLLAQEILKQVNENDLIKSLSEEDIEKDIQISIAVPEEKEESIAKTYCSAKIGYQNQGSEQDLKYTIQKTKQGDVVAVDNSLVQLALLSSLIHEKIWQDLESKGIKKLDRDKLFELESNAHVQYKQAYANGGYEGVRKIISDCYDGIGSNVFDQTDVAYCLYLDGLACSIISFREENNNISPTAYCTRDARENRGRSVAEKKYLEPASALEIMSDGWSEAARTWMRY